MQPGRPERDAYDAIVVGAGPNGLTAACLLARELESVLLVEAAETVGGGARTHELTVPGFQHDLCSAIHPLGRISAVFRDLDLEGAGLEWIEPPIALAHPFDDGTAAVLTRDVATTGAELGKDADSYQNLVEPLVELWPRIESDVLRPFSVWPKRPLAMARFGRHALRSARGLWRSRFRGERARALFAGLAAHSVVPLEFAGTASIGLVLALLAHRVGWPFPRRGAGAIPGALVKRFAGETITGWRVTSHADLPPAKVVLWDVSARGLPDIVPLPEAYARRLRRFRPAPGVFKVDYALNGPVPWLAEACRNAGTIHLGGRADEVTTAEREVWEGRPATRPFVLAAQQSLFDSTRAPDGQHTFWAYCHVPHGSDRDASEAIEAQIERFAPGFRDLVIDKKAHGPAAFERYNPNFVGGDITGGANTLRQILVRPTMRDPYRTPQPGVFLCSSSTPPGGGVHGLCGQGAAESALRYLKRAAS